MKDHTIRLEWTEGGKGTLFSRLFHSLVDADNWATCELRPYGIPYSFIRVNQ